MTTTPHPSVTLDLRLRVSLGRARGPVGPLVEALHARPDLAAAWLPHLLAVGAGCVALPPLAHALGAGDAALTLLAPLAHDLPAAALQALTAEGVGGTLVRLAEALHVEVEHATLVDDPVGRP